MAVLIVIRGVDARPFAEAMRALGPERDIRLWPDVGERRDIRYALAWKPPQGELSRCPRLRAIFSIGAGVDHLMALPDLPDVPVVRFVDPDLTGRMREYVVLHALYHHRRMSDYLVQQRRGEWRELDQPPAGAVRAGVMGLGVLGADCARALASLGFDVAGWSRSRRAIDGVTCFAGGEEQDAFLARTDILVCLLPLTEETRGILDRSLFARLAHDGRLPGPVLINAGRGGLQVEDDIVAALDDGLLWACSLDVFETEPLPSSSPLWSHPRVVVTPHNAAVSDPQALCRSVLAQIEADERGEPLRNVVKRARGY